MVKAPGFAAGALDPTGGEPFVQELSRLGIRHKGALSQPDKLGGADTRVCGQQRGQDGFGVVPAGADHLTGGVVVDDRRREAVFLPVNCEPDLME